MEVDCNHWRSLELDFRTWDLISRNPKLYSRRPVSDFRSPELDFRSLKSYFRSMELDIRSPQSDFRSPGNRWKRFGKPMEIDCNYSKSLGFIFRIWGIYFQKPDSIKFETPDNTTIIIIGINKQEVGEVSAKIRSLRKPEPYKGKGIKYSDEYIRRKAGKTVGA